MCAPGWCTAWRGCLRLQLCCGPPVFPCGPHQIPHIPAAGPCCMQPASWRHGALLHATSQLMTWHALSVPPDARGAGASTSGGTASAAAGGGQACGTCIGSYATNASRGAGPAGGWEPAPGGRAGGRGLHTSQCAPVEKTQHAPLRPTARVVSCGRVAGLLAGAGAWAGGSRRCRAALRPAKQRGWPVSHGIQGGARRGG